MDKVAVEQASVFMFADISHEIALANSSERVLGRLGLRLAKIPSGGGNFMAALALLSYTEYAGRLKNNDFSDGNSRKNFDSFFSDLGAGYKQLLAQPLNVYKIFRCGLAHEFYVKKDCIIAMRSNSVLNAGLGHDGQRYFFIVEKYHQDFTIAFRSLCANLT